MTVTSLFSASQKTLCIICSDQAVCPRPGPIAITVGLIRCSSKSCPEFTPFTITSGHETKLALTCSGLVTKLVNPAPE